MFNKIKFLQKLRPKYVILNVFGEKYYSKCILLAIRVTN